MHVMDSSNAGGVAAKYGFLYQDCAAAFFVTQMLRDKDIQAVRCEVIDDIDIIKAEVTEFIQVKTTDKNRWGITDLVKKAKGANSKLIPDSSILHKSMSCDHDSIVKAEFRILTLDKVGSALDYLTIPIKSRPSKSGRDKLFDSLSKSLNGFKTPNGNDIGYWIDSTWWQVIPSIRELELEAFNNIRYAAMHIYGVCLSLDDQVERIWRDIVYTLNKKSTLSRKVHTADEKTYSRIDFIEWIEHEIKLMALETHTYIKVYERQNIRPILSEFDRINSTSQPSKTIIALHQTYSLKQYRYKYVAESICMWLDELLLRPEEIADSININSTQKYSVLKQRLAASIAELEHFLGRALLHSTIRADKKSQPIPALLYIEQDGALKILDNVHIVRQLNAKDELWIGLSKILMTNNVHQTLTQMREELCELIIDTLDQARQKILDVKKDSYLVSHEINELLNVTQPFDNYIDRFRFAIFLGYESSHLTEPETAGYEISLKREISSVFELFLNDLVDSDHPLINIKLDIYLYPAPNNKTLLATVREKLESF